MQGEISHTHKPVSCINKYRNEIQRGLSPLCVNGLWPAGHLHCMIDTINKIIEMILFSLLHNSYLQ
jgi:hypothetical protein